MFSTYKKTTGKSVLFLLALAGVALFTACEKEEATREVEVTYNWEDEKPLPMDEMQKLADDPTISRVYIRPTGGRWEVLDIGNIRFHRNKFLQPRLDLSEKFTGRGDFTFKPGAASKTPNDSIWYVQHGWTINKALQNQK